MKKILNIKIGGNTGAGKSTFLYLIEEMLNRSGLSYYLHLDDEEIQDRSKIDVAVDDEEMLVRLKKTEINIQTQRLLTDFDFGLEDLIPSVKKENRELRAFVELLEKDKEDLLDELQDIKCMDALAKLLKEHGRK